MREIDKTIILMISKVVTSATIFVLSIFFARMLLKADYGTYIQINMVIGLLVLILSLGLPPSLFFFLPKKNNQKKLIIRTFIILFLIGCMNFVVLWCFKLKIASMLNNPELAKYVFLAGICITCRMSFNVIRPILMVGKETLVLSSINLAKGVLFLATMIGCLFINPNIVLLIYVFTINYVIEFFIALWVLIKFSGNFNSNYNDVIVPLRAQFKFSLPLAASGMLWILGREIDKYIISYFLNPADLAVYARGAVEIPLISIFAGTIAQVYLPDWVSLFDKKKYSTLLENWHLTLSKTALIMFPIFIIFQIIAYDFIVMMYSSEYSGSVIIFSIYLFMVPIQLTEYTAIVESSGKTPLISYGYIFQISFNIIFSVIMLKRFGSIGPAMMTVFSMYLWTGYMIYVISRIFKVSVYNVFPWMKLIKIMAICILSGVLPFFIKQIFDDLMVFQFLENETVIFLLKIGFVGILYICLYAIGLIVTKTLDQDDKATICRWLMIGKIKSYFVKTS